MDDKLDATDLPDWSWYRGHSGAWPLPFTHMAPGGVPGGHSVDDEPEALLAAAPATSTNDSRSRVAAMIRLYDLCGCCESPPLSSSSASYSVMSFSGQTLSLTLKYETTCPRTEESRVADTYFGERAIRA